MGRSSEELFEIGRNTRFSEKNQPENKREVSLLTRIKKKIFEEDSYMNFKGVEELGDDGTPTGRKVNVRIKLNNADALALRYNQLAMKDPRILKDFLDRVDGRAKQTIEVIDNKDEERIRDASKFLDSLSESTRGKVIQELRDKAVLGAK